MKRMIKPNTRRVLLIFSCVLLFENFGFANNSSEVKTQTDTAIVQMPGHEIVKDYVIHQYLEKKGYHILSDEGQVDSYQLTKERLISQYGVMEWGVQPFDPAPYIGNTINVRKFVVNNHRLDKLSEEKKTVVRVLIVNGIPIGGTSLPYSKEVILGGLYSLDGYTLEKIQGIKNYSVEYPEWKKRWSNNFSK